MEIGFIGLGNMGAPMADNLVKSGHHVTGFDVVARDIDGVEMAIDATSCAQGRDVVITMLPDGAILRDVASKIIPVMNKGALFCDCSTIDVETAKMLAKRSEEAGLLPLDAPVSGGISGAKAGSLTFMVGGQEAAFSKMKPLFDIMGNRAVHCGGAGAGQSVKICNNLILAVTMIGTCESIALGDRLGLDRQKLFDVLSTSTASSWSVNSYFPAKNVGPTSPADNDYKPGFACELMVKDLGLAEAAARAVKASTPMGAQALALYRQLLDEDGVGLDFSAMLPWFEKK